VENLRVGIVRALVCGFSSVLAMFREPGERSRPGRVRGPRAIGAAVIPRE
jgi:hypothetical protein